MSNRPMIENSDPRNTQAQIDAIAKALTALTERVDHEASVRDENHKMLSALHSALMIAQPGQDGKSLLERMADVTVEIESGKRTAANMVSIAKWFAAIAAFMAGLTAMKFGFWPDSKP